VMEEEGKRSPILREKDHRLDLLTHSLFSALNKGEGRKRKHRDRSEKSAVISFQPKKKRGRMDALRRYGLSLEKDRKGERRRGGKAPSARTTREHYRGADVNRKSDKVVIGGSILPRSGKRKRKRGEPRATTGRTRAAFLNARPDKGGRPVHRQVGSMRSRWRATKGKRRVVRYGLGKVASCSTTPAKEEGREKTQRSDSGERKKETGHLLSSSSSKGERGRKLQLSEPAGKGGQPARSTATGKKKGRGNPRMDLPFLLAARRKGKKGGGKRELIAISRKGRLSPPRGKKRWPRSQGTFFPTISGRGVGRGGRGRHHGVILKHIRRLSLFGRGEGVLYKRRKRFPNP